MRSSRGIAAVTKGGAAIAATWAITLNQSLTSAFTPNPQPLQNTLLYLTPTGPQKYAPLPRNF
jgi:hypothetical protein